MRVRSIKFPDKITLIESYRKNITDVILSVNFHEITVNEETQYEGDVYRFSVRSRANLYESINNNFDLWLNYAIENDKSIESPNYLKGLKVNKITKTKDMLKDYLEKNPLITNIRGEIETFNISKDKQISMYNTYNAFAIIGNGTLLYNASGEESKPISKEQLQDLITQTNNIVNPLVKYQQNLELSINSCSDYKQVESFVIDYRSKDIRYK